MPEAVPLIHNPAAGGGKGRARLQEGLRVLSQEGIVVQPMATERPGHASLLARALADDGVRQILLLGGDGTFSEAANGVLGLPPKDRPVLGIIPAGTGNDFLRDFGVHDMVEAVRRISAGKPRAVDAGRVEDGAGATFWSVNIFGTGFAAEAVELTNRRLKWLGRHAYNAAVLARLAALSPTPTTLVLDGKEITGDFPLVMACNTVHTGAGMMMAPKARADDGWLDVLTVEDVSRGELVSLLLKLKDGSHVGHSKVGIHRARRIEVRPEREGPLLVDGEIVGRTPATVEVEPGALQVLV